jgi:hypothetical protein
VTLGAGADRPALLGLLELAELALGLGAGQATRGVLVAGRADATVERPSSVRQRP